VRNGFRGPVHCTPATEELLGTMLRDAAELQEEEAATANRYVNAGASMAEIKRLSAAQRRKPPEPTNGDCPGPRRRRYRLVA